ncbi:ABC transporter G family member 25 [Typha latifolia]|uniref:ABC transporter G family member 25 n=1 Tax=Typha latifolia TaxID=4733 RepID=UPI003C2B8A5A
MPPNNTQEVDSKTDSSSFFSSTCSYPLTLQFIDVTYRIKVGPASDGSPGRLKRIFHHGGGGAGAANPEERTILNAVTGRAVPGEILAVLGPSGSGKSTLLSILAGRLPNRANSGSVLYNNRRLTRSVAKRTGFVSQDDLLYPHLTVRETLLFCAMLRLPEGTAPAAKAAAAEAVIAELGLGRCADSVVGNAFVRGVSGGERKRVSIAHEMLVNPSALILDEPTSGLDSTAAARLVATLAGLARKGRTVVASVHQPSSRVYQMFDSVLLLAEGNCFYFGPGKDAMDYFSSVGFAPSFHVNPADFMLDLANGFAEMDYQGDHADKSSVKQALISSYNRVLGPKVKASTTAAVGDAPHIGSQRSFTSDHQEKKYSSSRISWFRQFTILLHRSLKERRHETFNSLRVFQVMAAAFLAGFMWWHSKMYNVQDRLGLLFFISIFWGVFASFNSVFTFPQERAIFVKERSSGMYTLSSYFMARMAGDLPMELILPTLFMLIMYWMAGLRPDVGAFLLTVAVLLGYVLVAQGLGLAVGAIIMDAKQASTLVTITMLAFLLTGGFYVQNVPSCMTWVKYISFTFYCYKLLVAVQYNAHELASLGLSHHGNRKDIIAQELEEQVSATLCVVALLVMFVGYRCLAYIALRRIKT